MEATRAQRDLVLAASKERDDGKRILSCHKAHTMSSEQDIPLKIIGAICNDEGIRIVACELGCFK